MSYIRLLPVFILFIVTACTQDRSNIYPVRIIDKNLEAAHSQEKKSNSLKRKGLRLEKDDVTKTVESCNELMSSVDKGYVLMEQVNNMMSASEYQECFQLNYLKNAVASKTSLLKKPYTKMLITQLDLRTLRSSFKQRLDGDTTQTIMDVDFLKPVINGNSIIAETEDWFYKITILAKGDFNRDGDEDLLVEFIDQARQGNYFSHATLIVRHSNKTVYFNAVY